MHQVLKRVNIAKGCNDSTWYLIVYKVIKLKETPPSQQHMLLLAVLREGQANIS
jgi:hypothetical protein